MRQDLSQEPKKPDFDLNTKIDLKDMVQKTKLTHERAHALKLIKLHQKRGEEGKQ